MRLTTLALPAALIVALASRAHAQVPGEVPDLPRSLGTLGWMSGCWERSTASQVIEEQWMLPRGGAMLGMSRTTASGVMREFEFLRIAMVDGVATYLAQPGGAAVTPFAASAITDSSVTFSNPAHDFPQRIIYRRRAGGDSLLARIEGTRGTSVRGIDFPMKRVPCPGAPVSPR